MVPSSRSKEAVVATVSRSTLIAAVEEGINDMDYMNDSELPQVLREYALTADRFLVGDWYNTMAECGCPLEAVGAVTVTLDDHGNGTLDPDPDMGYLGGFWQTFDREIRRSCINLFNGDVVAVRDA
jgi:hypothetical protein